MNTFSTLIAAIIAIGVPGIFLLIIYTLDLYASRNFRLAVIAFLWGAIGAYFISYQLNTYVGMPWLRSLGVSNAMLIPTLSVYFAPIIEELAKSLSLFYISRRKEFTYFVDGAIYGFAAGIGFAIHEIFLYMDRNPSQAIATALVRAFSTCLMHGTAAGLVGAAVGRVRFRKQGGQVLGLLGGWGAAILLHALFNRFIETPIIGIIVGLTGVGLIAFFIARGLQEQREWLTETLNKQVGVIDADRRATQSYGTIDDMIQPLIDQFPKKADEIRDLLLCQAQLGIKRKVQQQLDNAKLKAQLDPEIDQLQVKIKHLRSEIGPFILTYVRAVFPEGALDIWGRLEMIAAQGGPADSQQWMNILEKKTTELPKQNLFSRLQQTQETPDPPPTDEV